MLIKIYSRLTFISRPISIIFIRLLEILFPKDEKLILFGAMNGLWYGDNSQHLYEWLLERPEKGLNPLWITRNKSVYKQLIQEGRPVAFALSFKGLKAIATAKVGVFTDNLKDLTIDPWILPLSLKLIALRHGRSVKRVRFARLGHKISPKEAEIRRRESELIEYAISTSEFISDLQEECLQLGRSKHVVTGYPRNDNLLKVPNESKMLWERFLDKHKPKKVILYAPSWRHGRTYTRFFPFEDFSASDIIQTCEEHKCLLLLRPHRLDLNYIELRKLFDELTKSPWIKLATHNELPDVNTFLPFVDGLISDYSALFHDYLLLDRPIIFTPYDYDDFKEQNGFLYDYYENLPGPAVTNYADFKQELLDIVADNDNYLEKRMLLKNKIHEIQDPSSCENVINIIKRVLQD